MLAEAPPLDLKVLELKKTYDARAHPRRRGLTSTAAKEKEPRERTRERH